MPCQVFHLPSSSCLVLSLQREISRYVFYYSLAILYHCLTLVEISAHVVNQVCIKHFVLVTESAFGNQSVHGPDDLFQNPSR